MANAARFLRKLTGGQASVPRIVRMIQTYERRLARWREFSFPAACSRDVVGVLVCPWLETATPLFSVECALALASVGHEVILIWDHGEPFGSECYQQERKSMEALLAKLPPRIQVLTPDVSGNPTTSKWLSNAGKIVRNNAIARKKGEDAACEYYEENRQVVAGVAAHFEKIESLFKKCCFQWVMVPGGVYSTSAIYRDMASAAGVPCTTFDSDLGMVMFSNNGVVTHHSDIPQAHRLLSEDLNIHSSAREKMHQSVAAELEARCQGTDFWSFQKTSRRGVSGIPCDVLVPLNLRWDTAALDRELAFPSTKEWIATILDWARRNPLVHVCIRQHPCERHAYARGTDDIAAWISALGGELPNVHFIKADDSMSTYDLLSTTRLVVPHTSTIVLEAALRGIPSVLASRVYYEDHGFTWSCQNQAEFIERLEDGLAGRLTVSAEARDKAETLFFLTQMCVLLKTRFTPIPEDFSVWSGESIPGLWSQTETQDILHSLSDRKPLSYLRALRLLGLEHRFDKLSNGCALSAMKSGPVRGGDATIW